MERYLHTGDLSVGYNGTALIRDIVLDIRKGEVVTLIGPNGSGKSTILKSLTRQLKLIGGKVYIGEKDISTLNRKELATRMAVVLTERVRPEMMTCRDIVATGRYPYTGRLGLLTDSDEAKVDHVMELMRVTELADRNFDAISDGQRQRVLLARAVCQEPEIIILDEPTSYLDIRHKLELLTILRDMAKDNGITVVMSLHEIDLAQKISDRVICVKGDHIALMGPPEEIFTENAVEKIYEIDSGSYDPLFGSVELAKTNGEAKAFVLCGCGTGIPIFHKLQKQGIPFVAGVLYENDVDYRLAKRLASKVIAQSPFTIITESTMNEAKKQLECCEYLIDAHAPVGDCNRCTLKLVEKAKAQGKLKEAEDI